MSDPMLSIGNRVVNPTPFQDIVVRLLPAPKCNPISYPKGQQRG